MRIVAGRFRGRRLAGPGRGDAAARLRPTTDRVRESLFSVLTAGALGDAVTGARVLDLFAGSGALALEALSRGAASATLVDSGARARALIAENIERTGTAAQTAVIRRDATRLGRCRAAPHSLVFLDPPYGGSLGVAALRAAAAGGWLAGGALIVWEEAAPQAPPGARFTLRDRRRYGDTHLTILQWS